jgi:ABC-type transporter MlaC component
MICTSSKSRRYTDVVVAALLVLVPVAQAANPSETVTTMADAVIRTLKDDGLDRAAKRARVEEIVYGAVDFETLSRLVMARNWPRLDAGQQAEFRREFKRHLSATYGRRVDSYANETVEVTGRA